MIVPCHMITLTTLPTTQAPKFTQPHAMSTIQATETPSGTTINGPWPFTYNSTHGDFCFLCLADAYPGATDSDYMRYLYILPSSSFILPLKNRTGTFPFMKLSIEVRFMIYKLVFTPLFSKHTFLKDRDCLLALSIRQHFDAYHEQIHEMANHILEHRLRTSKKTGKQISERGEGSSSTLQKVLKSWLGLQNHVPTIMDKS